MTDDPRDDGAVPEPIPAPPAPIPAPPAPIPAPPGPTVPPPGPIHHWVPASEKQTSSAIAWVAFAIAFIVLALLVGLIFLGGRGS
jgi:hypothetical protein